MKEVIIMTVRESQRIAVLDKLVKKEIKQKKAANILGLSVRQVRRLVKRYRRDGVKGIIHKLRGVPSNHKSDPVVLAQAVEVIQKRYHDFSPTLAHEKLTEHHQFPYSREKLRQTMIECGIWQEKKKKVLVLHPMRERRASEGELVQADGSPHAWFEERGEYCNLLVFVDDATSKLKHLSFVDHETTNDYFAATKSYLEEHGKPLALYVDRHSIFKLNHKGGRSSASSDSTGLTQYGRACLELDIELICANSAQAKGRVERINKTLQDRLVKELRLLGINNIKEANKYLPIFIKQYNQRFAVMPRNIANVHRPLSAQEDLSLVLVQKHTRILSRNLTCSYKTRLYQVLTKKSGYALRRAQVQILENNQGKVVIMRKGVVLKYKTITKQEYGLVVESKRLNDVVDNLSRKPRYVPSRSHPWKRFNYAAT